MNREKNQRYRDTEDLIFDSYIQILSEDPKALSVANICRATGLNRSSFYLHFLDIPDLREQAVKKLLVDRMQENLRRKIWGSLAEEESGKEAGDDSWNRDILNERMSVFNEAMLTYIRENRKLYQLLWTDFETEFIRQSSRDLFQNFMIPIIEGSGELDEKQKWYIFSFFHAGFLALVHEWLMRDCPDEPAELSAIIMGCFPKA